MANYASINIDLTSGVFTWAGRIGPTTLASGGTDLVALWSGPNDNATIVNKDLKEVIKGINAALINYRAST
jgi:hypothetical protein